MMTNMILCILFAVVFATGVFFVERAIGCKCDKLDGSERVAYAAGSGMVVLAFVAMLLALFGAYHIGSVLVGYLLITAGIYVVIYLPKRSRGTAIKFEKPLFFILIIAAILYLAFPTYYMWSGRDYGVYFLNAIHTAETGSSFYETDAFLNDDYEVLDEVIDLGYPAFYSSYEEGISDNPGDINTQFRSMYWCFLAIGYSLCGIEGLVRSTAFLALASLSVYYFFLKRFWGTRVAAIATAVFAICPAQIWGARITQSEQLAQLLFWLMVAFFSIGWKENQTGWMHMGVVFLGMGCLCRMDHYIFGIGLLCVGIYTALWCKDKSKQLLGCVLHYVGWFVISIVSGFMVHYSYYMDHWNVNVLKMLVLFNLCLMFLYLCTYVVLSIRKTEMKNVAKILLEKKCVITILMVVLTGGLVFLFFVGGGLKQYSYYICPVMLFFMVAGIKQILQDAKDTTYYHENFEAVLFYLVCGAASTILYTIKPSITMDHFFMSRRWIVVNFSFIIGLSAVAFDALMKWNISKKVWMRAKQLCLLGCGLFIIGYMVKQNGVLWNISAYKGMPEQYQTVAKQLPDDALILTQEETVAGMLHYVYGKNIYLVKSDLNEEQVIKYIKNGNTIYLLGNMQNGILLWGMEHQLISENAIDVMAPECTYGEFPRANIPFIEQTNLYQLSVGNIDTVDLMDRVSLTDRGMRNADEIEMTNTGHTFYGPYSHLEPGRYYLHAEFEADASVDESIGIMEIVVNEEVIKAEEILGTDESFTMEFEISEENAIVQTRLLKEVEESVRCTELYLEK